MIGLAVVGLPSAIATTTRPRDSPITSISAGSVQVLNEARAGEVRPAAATRRMATRVASPGRLDRRPPHPFTLLYTGQVYNLNSRESSVETVRREVDNAPRTRSQTRGEETEEEAGDFDLRPAACVHFDGGGSSQETEEAQGRRRVTPAWHSQWRPSFGFVVSVNLATGTQPRRQCAASSLGNHGAAKIGAMPCVE